MEWSWSCFLTGLAAGIVIGFGVGFVALGLILGITEDVKKMHQQKPQ
jgi:hypothetical protein